MSIAKEISVSQVSTPFQVQEITEDVALEK